jgi:phosphatidylglycerol:prolipoprotein diacylglycerol transferase
MLPYGPITEIHLGPITIQTWGLMVALGFIVGIFLILHQARREGYKVDKLIDLSLIIFIAAMIGSRVFYVILFWPDFVGQWIEALKIWKGGMVFYGGFIFAVAAWLIYARAQKMNVWKMADWGAPALAIGLAIGRVGCHLIQDHPGTPTSVPWGINYGGMIRHETALYDLLANLIIFLLIWLWLRRKNLPVGLLFFIYLAWAGMSRFVIDFFRACDLPHSDPRFFVFGNFGGLTISQIIAVGLVIIGVLTVKYLYRRRPANEFFLESSNVTKK